MEKALSSSKLEFWTPRVSKTGPDRTMLGVVWVPRDSLFASACRGKGKFRALWECSRWPFPPACRGKGLFGSFPGAYEVPLGFRGSVKLLNLLKLSCFPLDFGELLKPDNPGARDGLGVCLQWMALWACSRWAFPPACRGKGYFEAPWGCSRSSFPVPVEEKAISRLPWDARGRLFPVPVEEKTILFGLSPLPVEEKAVAMACSPCLSRKRPYRRSLGLSGLSKRLWASPGLSGPLCPLL